MPTDHQVLVVALDAHFDDRRAYLQVHRSQTVLPGLILTTLRVGSWKRSCNHVVDELANVVAVDRHAHDSEGLVLDAPICRIEHKDDCLALLAGQ